jgi:hypothetical protein
VGSNGKTLPTFRIKFCHNNQLVNISLLGPRRGLPKEGTTSAETSTEVTGIV